MKALVTGGSGFLGSHLVERLVSEGIETICFVRPEDDLRWIEALDIRRIYGDCTDKDSIRPVFDDPPDFIFHLAGIANAPSDDVYNSVNAGGTQNIVELCLENNISLKRFVLTSSASVMGPSERGSPRSENDDFNPTTAYGRSKVEAEAHVRELDGHIPWTILRLGLIYGPRATHGFFPVFRMAARGFLPLTGQMNGNMIHVEDAARCLIHVARHESAIDRIYLVGEESPSSLEEIVNEIVSSVGRRVVRLTVPLPLLYPIALALQVIGRIRGRVPLLDLRRLDDMRHRDWLIDSSLIRDETGFTPEIDLATGIRQSVDWYREAGWIR
ncbi:NAD-dependent epimerase/dehydratase family protein [Gemmatimonadota bacterium]